MKILLWKCSKYLLFFLASCIILVLGYLLFAWILSYSTTNPKAHQCTQKHTIYASSNGVHMDLILHKNDLNADFLIQMEQLENRDFIAIGWGDEGFYLHTPSWAELKVSTAIKAALLPSNTVMHVTHYNKVNPKWKTIQLCPAQLQALQLFIEQSFARNTTNNVQILEGAGYRFNDFFYRAEGSYTCFYTCNVWVNQALKKADVKTAIWSPFDKGILKHL